MNIEHRTPNIEWWMGKEEETDFWHGRLAVRVFGENHFDIVFLKTIKIKLLSAATSLFDVQRWTFDVRRSSLKTTKVNNPISASLIRKLSPSSILDKTKTQKRKEKTMLSKMKFDCRAKRYHYSMFNVGRSMFDVRVSRRHTALSLSIQTVRFKWT